MDLWRFLVEFDKDQQEDGHVYRVYPWNRSALTGSTRAGAENTEDKKQDITALKS